MKRKTYTTARERKIDQLIGFGASLLVNGVLWIGIASAPRSTGLLLLPWIINGGILALVFLFRPAVAVGYIAFIGIALGGSFVLGVLFVGACFAWYGITSPANYSWNRRTDFRDIVGSIVGLGMFFGGLLFLLIQAFRWVRAWWSEDK